MDKDKIINSLDKNYDIKNILEDNDICEFTEPYKSYIIASYLIELFGKDILLKLIKYTNYVDNIDENSIIVDATRHYLKKYKIKIKYKG